MSAIADTATPMHQRSPGPTHALVLAVAQALAGANNIVLVATGGLVGAMLAPDRGLATLPITVYVVGLWMGRCRSACWRGVSGVARRSRSAPCSGC